MSNSSTSLETQLTEVDRLINVDVKEALLKAQEFFKAAKKEKNDYFQGMAYRRMAMCYYKTGKLIEALTLFEKSKKSWALIKNYENIVSDLISLGVVYRNLGQIDKALENYLDAQKVSEEKNIEKATLYNNIAVIYYNQRELEKALKYYNLSLSLEESSEHKNLNNIATILNNIALIHIENKNYNIAKKFYKKTEEISLNKFKPPYLAAQRGLGKIEFEEGKFLQSYNRLITVLQISEEIKLWGEFIKISIELSPILKALKKYDERTSKLKIALDKAIDFNQDSIILCLESLLEHYEEMDDFVNAYNVLKQLSSLREQVLELEKSQKISSLQSSFELREKDKLIEQEKLFRKTLETQNAQLLALNQELQQFNYAVSHDLKEPLRSIKAYSKFVVMRAKSKLETDELDALQKMEESIQRINVMIDDLLSFATLGASEKNTTEVDLNEVLAIVQADLQAIIKETNTSIKVGNLPKILAHKSLMVQLFQNLINNAIKFRKLNENAFIEIENINKPEFFEIRVKDNGVGIPEKNQLDVFKIFKRLDKTRNIEGTGIGLSLCQKIVTKMQGQISLASKENIGTTFILKLPKN